MSFPRSLRTPEQRRDDRIGAVILVAVFVLLLLCAVIGANR